MGPIHKLAKYRFFCHQAIPSGWEISISLLKHLNNVNCKKKPWSNKDCPNVSSFAQYISSTVSALNWCLTTARSQVNLANVKLKTISLFTLCLHYVMVEHYNWYISLQFHKTLVSVENRCIYCCSFSSHGLTISGGRRFDILVVAGGTVRCRYNLRYYRWRRDCRLDDLLLSALNWQNIHTRLYWDSFLTEMYMVFLYFRFILPE